MKLFKRPPDLVVGDPDDPYLRRWWLIPRNRWFNVYLHNILRSDESRDLHDHPWPSVSVTLKGLYYEVVLAYFMGFKREEIERRGLGSVVTRKPSTLHRVLLGGAPPTPAWTLFITGPRVREWGFHTSKGWVHNKEYKGSWEASQ